MKNIGLVDDRDSMRKAFMRKLNLKLEKSFKGWQIIDVKPFKELESYRQWILENNISILILDERLNEGKLDDGSNVGYYGSDLVKVLREYFKDFPIYCITSYTIEQSLLDSMKYFNLILDRSTFNSNIDNYLNSFIKSGISFYNEYKKELEQLGLLSEKVAHGIANPNDISELQSIQTNLLIPHITNEIKSREEYLTQLEKSISEIKSLHSELIKILNSK